MHVHENACKYAQIHTKKKTFEKVDAQTGVSCARGLRLHKIHEV